MDELFDLFKEDIEILKQELQDEALVKIDAKIPKDTGSLANSLNVEWLDNELVATTDTEYDTFVRHGYVTTKGNIIDGRDYLDVEFGDES